MKDKRTWLVGGSKAKLADLKLTENGTIVAKFYVPKEKAFISYRLCNIDELLTVEDIHEVKGVILETDRPI